ncbi:MAG: hypothetical protein EA424_04425 [Planctomycetaceae bacterium]|nr:MAG: hypothetical protein EA424_04425 [Planctomycetaceae bacterium]
MSADLGTRLDAGGLTTYPHVEVMYANHAWMHEPPESTLNVAFGAAALRNNDGSVTRPADANWRRMVRAKR